MGLIDKLKKGAKKAGDKYKAWEADAPKREQAAFEKLKKEQKKLRVQADIEKQKAAIARSKSQRRKLTQSNIGSMGGGSIFGGGFIEPQSKKGKKAKKTPPRWP